MPCINTPSPLNIDFSRIPLVAICVGLAINKELRAGIVYNPVTRELYTAQVGCGAFRNGFPIHVSSTTGFEIFKWTVGRDRDVERIAVRYCMIVWMHA
ncbi:unnamed protein product [Strongylus vulgaris]|uniref:Uncharacterized protein n=1 Tax=Strongylus vulgaris TaxID=40348 RepID=A0A3P7LYQ8_STRVU|nr:unnamed protein product [Strongylus vulgaris]